MAKTTPAFQFYPADFLVATSEWTDEEVGIYARLLFNQWINGSIPKQFKRMASLVSASQNELEKLWPLIGQKFIDGKEPDRLINPRLEEVRKNQESYRANQSKNGQAGALKRWGKNGTAIKNDSDPNSNPNGEQYGEQYGENIALQSSVFVSSLHTSSSSSSSGRDDTIVSSVHTTGDPPENPFPKTPPCPYRKIIDGFHNTLPELNQVKAANMLKKNFRARWREEKERQSVEWWIDFFKTHIRTSKFLMGKKTDFQATLGWIVGPRNFEKIVNGQYVDRDNLGQTGTKLGDRNAQACREFIDNE